MDPKQVEIAANEMRKDIISMIAEAKSGHPGGSLSCIDILSALYLGDILDHCVDDPQRPDRDRFIMSKGHAAPALYAVLGHVGFIPKNEFLTLRKWGSRLQGHPDSSLCPGVEVSTGSLGQGLSIACGMACGLRLERIDSSIFALLGDGECEEGQIWEAAMFAANQDLDNLIAIVDANGLQIDGNVDDVAGLGDLASKFEAFGWEVTSVDGHSIPDLIQVLSDSKKKRDGKPKAVIAKTVKGKGVSFMENQAGWHGKAPNAEETQMALEEIDNAISKLKAEG